LLQEILRFPLSLHSCSATIVDTKAMYWVKLTSNIINTKPIEQVTTIPTDAEVVAANTTIPIAEPAATTIGVIDVNVTGAAAPGKSEAINATATGISEAISAAANGTIEDTTTSAAPTSPPIAETASQTSSPIGTTTTMGNDTSHDIPTTIQALAGRSGAITPGKCR